MVDHEIDVIAFLVENELCFHRPSAVAVGSGHVDGCGLVQVNADTVNYRANRDPGNVRKFNLGPSILTIPGTESLRAIGRRRKNDSSRTSGLKSVGAVAGNGGAGEILATREQLAADIGILPCNVSRAMSELVKIGAIVRHRRGRKVVYSINPNIGWNGGEGSRQAAARKAPALRLVVEGDNTP